MTLFVFESGTIYSLRRKHNIFEDRISWKFLRQMEIKRSLSECWKSKVTLFCRYFCPPHRNSLRTLFLDMDHLGAIWYIMVLVPFGDIYSKRVWCVARSDNLFYVLPSSFKVNNFSREY